MKRRIVSLAAALLALGLLAPGQGRAQKEVVIGVLYPLSGPVAQVGRDAVDAVNTAVDIVNNDVDIDVPLGPGKGLPNLGGARVRVVVADHRGRPEVGQREAERLIVQAHVVALFGAYYSSVTATASQVAERYRVPFVNAASSSPQLTERGLKWFFRTGPHDGSYTGLMFAFMRDLEGKRGVRLGSVGILHEDTLWGRESARAEAGMAKAAAMRIAADIAYAPNAPSFDEAVQRLKAADPAVLLPSSYTADALRFLRTAKALDYNPRLLIAQDAGYADPALLSTLGRDAEGVITRAPYNDDLGKSIPLIAKVEPLFKRHSKGRALSDVPARVFTGFITLLDAINRAGSTDPEAIRRALTETDIPADRLIVPWRGIRFGANGQNQLVRGILMQVQHGRWCTVYPFELAACDVLYPMPTWQQKAGR